MKVGRVGMVMVLILAGGLSAQKAPSYSVRTDDTFTGQITDSLCAGNGDHIRLLKNEKNCILTCVKFDGAQFVLYNSESKSIYKLDDQEQPEAFAGQDVTVIGKYDKETRTIHVINIRPKVTYARLGDDMSFGKRQLQ